MPEVPCSLPVQTTPEGCGGSIANRVSALEAELLTQRALTNTIQGQYCALREAMIVGITFADNLDVILTYGDGRVVQGPDNGLTALQALVTSLQSTLNDRVVRGEITEDGTLNLITNNNVVIEVGNLIDAVNPVRGIKIRNDNYIVLTLKDGTTQIVTDSPIPTAVATGGGGGSDVLLNFLADPVNALNATSGNTGNINIGALGGVTVPLTATHVILRCTVEHAWVWQQNFNKDSYTTLKISGKERLTAGRKKESGDNAVIGTGGVMTRNSMLVIVPLPGTNIVSYEVISNFDGSPTSPQTNFTTVRATVDVIGFCKADTQ